MYRKLIIIVSIFLVSCDSNIYYIDYNSIDGSWHKDSLQTYNFELNLKEKSSFTSYVNLRINEDYMFNNIFLIVTLRDSLNIISARHFRI